VHPTNITHKTEPNIKLYKNILSPSNSISPNPFKEGRKTKYKETQSSSALLNA